LVIVCQTQQIVDQLGCRAAPGQTVLHAVYNRKNHAIALV
jgi:hypothetical protein